MSDLADKLTQAFDNRNNDMNRWMWKTSNGNEVRMLDLNPDQLQHAYKHVTEMLFNKDPYHPGVQRKQDQVRKMWDCANAELLLRYILYDCKVEGLKTNKDLLDYITAHKRSQGLSEDSPVTAIFDGLPEVFTKISIDLLVDACLDTLPAFNRKLISDKFIISIGIWLTEQEKKDLTEYDERGVYRSRKDVIKERLLLNPMAEIRFDSKGLSFAEFRSLIRVDGHPKFSMMTTDVIRLLRDKVLLLLDQDLNYHIEKWTVLKDRLEMVANQKGLILDK